MKALTWPQVTNWRLASGQLARRGEPATMVAVVAMLCGAHAQLATSVPLTLAARVSGLTRPRVDAALDTERSLVKTWAMRGTLHVMAAGDLPLYCAAQRTREVLSASFLKYRGLGPDDVEAVLDAVPRALDGQRLTRDQLAGEVLRITRRPWLEADLRSGWGGLLKPAAARGLLCFGPPAGRGVTFVRPDQWLGHWEDFDTDDALRAVVRRFLAAYAPASRGEVARWWGMRPGEAGRVLGLLGDDLAEVEVGGTRRWVLACDLPALEGAAPVEGVRLLPSFDQLLVMSAPHPVALVDPEHTARVYRPRIAVWSLPAVLVDGRARGAWSAKRKGARLVVRVEPFEKLSRGSLASLAEEAQSLGAVLGAEPQLEVAPD